MKKSIIITLVGAILFGVFAVASPVKADSCDPSDVSVFFSGGTATFQNNSAKDCQVGEASYKDVDGILEHQELYRYTSGIIKAGGTLTLSVGLPGCATQIDAYTDVNSIGDFSKETYNGNGTYIGSIHLKLPYCTGNSNDSKGGGDKGKDSKDKDQKPVVIITWGQPSCKLLGVSDTSGLYYWGNEIQNGSLFLPKNVKIGYKIPLQDKSWNLRYWVTVIRVEGDSSPDHYECNATPVMTTVKAKLDSQCSHTEIYKMMEWDRHHFSIQGCLDPDIVVTHIDGTVDTWNFVPAFPGEIFSRTFTVPARQIQVLDHITHKMLWSFIFWN